MKKQPRSFGVSLLACGRLHARAKSQRCTTSMLISTLYVLSLIVMQERASIAFIGSVEQAE